MRRLTTRRKMSLVITVIAVILAVAAPAWAADPQGYVEDELNYGYFFDDLDQGVAVFAGGPVESFCSGHDKGSAPLRVFERSDGSVDLKANARNQPFWVYHVDVPAPVLEEQVCTGQIAPPDAFATGTGNLKVRISILADGIIDVFNGINGTATAADGTEWKVRTWADLTLVNGVPQGDPAEFQGLKIQQIGS